MSHYVVKNLDLVGRGGGRVVSMLAVYSVKLSSNPAEAYSFFVKFVFEKNKNKQEEARVGPFLLNSICRPFRLELSVRY